MIARWIPLSDLAWWQRPDVQRVLGAAAIGTGLLMGGLLLWNRALRRAVAQRTEALQRELAERQRLETRLRTLAEHDPLTGLMNRAALTEALRRSLALAARQKWAVAVVFIDLDEFKAVNDTLGHAAGDDLLRQIASRLQDCLRESDLLGRLGGDEFIVVAEALHDGPRNAIEFADKLLTQVKRPFLVQGRTLTVGFSAGIAIYPGDGDSPPETLIVNARHGDVPGQEAGAFPCGALPAQAGGGRHVADGHRCRKGSRMTIARRGAPVLLATAAMLLAWPPTASAVETVNVTASAPARAGLPVANFLIEWRIRPTGVQASGGDVVITSTGAAAVGATGYGAGTVVVGTAAAAAPQALRVANGHETAIRFDRSITRTVYDRGYSATSRSRLSANTADLAMPSGSAAGSGSRSSSRDQGCAKAMRWLFTPSTTCASPRAWTPRRHARTRASSDSTSPPTPLSASSGADVGTAREFEVATTLQVGFDAWQTVADVGDGNEQLQVRVTRR